MEDATGDLFCSLIICHSKYCASQFMPLRSVCGGNTAQHPANILGFEYTGRKGAGGGLLNRGGAG